ncbi:MAG: glycosyl transferase [Bacilli bacterium]|nr:glycosyl transferase [Bacilli bacterium]
MIPKKIHYIWFGKGEKNERVKHCIESWKKYLPDYEIIEWNEDNFDINYNDFTKNAYANKKWAFVSDVARLWVLYNEGGIYMDTDVEVYKSLDPFLNDEGFTGFEDVHYPVTATLGAVKGNPVIKLMLDYYNCIDFKLYENWQDYIKYQETNTCIMSNIFSILGVNRDWNATQRIKHFTIYPQSYFFTKDEGWTWHSFNGSW